jgi:DNA (cytosine-5)-methyltransferase 1
MPSTKENKIVFADVFAGLQGLFAIEHDKFAFETLRANFLAKTAKHKFKWPEWLPKKPISVQFLLANYRSHLHSLTGSIDLLVGGPPCQGFSSAGRRNHDDPRNKLFASYLEIVEILRPRAVLIENVRGFTMDFDTGIRVQNFAEELRNRLLSTYSVFEELLDLSNFGVPQSRVRYFLLAIEPDLCTENPFNTLRNRLPAYLRAMGLQTPVSSRSAISDLEISRGGRQASRDTPGFDDIKYTAPSTRFQKLMGQGTHTPSDLRLARHSQEIAKRFSEIIELSNAEGRLNRSISEEVRARYGMRKTALRVLDPDRPSPTVTSMPDDLLHYSEPRTLTVRENARLQSFPDWFSFKGKYTTGGLRRRVEVPRFTQVANAVPPLAARAVGEMLIELLSRPGRRHGRIGPIEAFERFRQTPKVVAQV